MTLKQLNERRSELFNEAMQFEGMDPKTANKLSRFMTASEAMLKGCRDKGVTPNEKGLALIFETALETV